MDVMAVRFASLIVVSTGGVSAEQAGVCGGSGSPNFVWLGMTKTKCLERATEEQTVSAGSCAFVSFVDARDTEQSSLCSCFKANQCDKIQAQRDGHDGSWTTWATGEIAVSTTTQPSTPAPTLAPIGAPTVKDASPERNGVCAGNGYQNLGWSGMSKEKCIERAAETHSAGSCAYVSYAPSFNHGQTGCFCFRADQCQNTKPSPDGRDGEWKTWTLEHAQKITAGDSLSGAPAVANLALATIFVATASAVFV